MVGNKRGREEKGKGRKGEGKEKGEREGEERGLRLEVLGQYNLIAYQ